MEQLSLRSYHREIERLIENSSFDTAIAHCRHILKAYPKNIDTYRLLGKAYLESQHYVEAIDIFQRVLSVYPDDFLAHLGLSIIKEEQGNLDAAIWHLERAYEVQPSNPALQAELKRLHGRRDGIEPPKVRLTRAALARMYQRGELYSQALAEVQTALAEDPSRIDLVILQAELLSQLGKHSESFQIASKLLSKLPYSYQANKIISQSESYTDDPGIVNKARGVLSAIDPYESQLISQAESAEGLSENMIMVEKLAVPVSNKLATIRDSEESIDTSYAAESGLTEGEQNVVEVEVESELSNITEEAQLPIIEHLVEESEAPVQSEFSGTEEVVTDEQRKKVISKMMIDLTDLDGELDPSLEDTVKITIAHEPEVPPEKIETAETETPAAELEKHHDPDFPSWLSGLEPKPDQSGEFKEISTVPEWLFAMDDSLTESDRVVTSALDENGHLEFADTSEIDQAIAWLEGLAEKHGVEGSSLLLPTENRTQEPPEWISRLKNILNDEEIQQMEAVEQAKLEEVTESVLISSPERVIDEEFGELSDKSEEIIEIGSKSKSGDEVQNPLTIQPSLSDISDTSKIGEAIETNTASQFSAIEDIMPNEPELASGATRQDDSAILDDSDTATPKAISAENQNAKLSGESYDKPHIDIIEKADGNVEQFEGLAQSTLETEVSGSNHIVEKLITDESTDTLADNKLINVDQLTNEKQAFAMDQGIDNLTDEQADHPSSPDLTSDEMHEGDAESTQAEIEALSTTIRPDVINKSQDEQISEKDALDIKQEEAVEEIRSVDSDPINAQDTVAAVDELSKLEQLSADNPEDIETLRQLAKAYTKSGKFDDAKSTYKQIEKILRQ